MQIVGRLPSRGDPALLPKVGMWAVLGESWRRVTQRGTARRPSLKRRERIIAMNPTNIAMTRKDHRHESDQHCNDEKGPSS